MLFLLIPMDCPQIPLISPLDAQPSFSRKPGFSSSLSLTQKVSRSVKSQKIYDIFIVKLTDTVSLVLLEETRVLY